LNSPAQANNSKGAKCKNEGQRPGKSVIMRYHQAPAGRQKTTSGMPTLQGLIFTHKLVTGHKGQYFKAFQMELR